mmetsp:Transcript_15688/g.39883  ORF Transcript_15688/g.39883 Transcript_15688/m.39883 type:complete len:102 (-) Transcript_15688:136-441(-)
MTHEFFIKYAELYFKPLVQDYPFLAHNRMTSSEAWKRRYGMVLTRENNFKATPYEEDCEEEEEAMPAHDTRLLHQLALVRGPRQKRLRPAYFELSPTEIQA